MKISNMLRVSVVAAICLLCFTIGFVATTRILLVSTAKASVRSQIVLHDELQQAQMQNIQNDAALDVASVFGRSRGCVNADHAFVRLVAEEAISTGVQPKILAAVIATESQCNQFAVSRRGAIGYTQVMPSVWGKTYDFSGKYNLFNPKDNLHVGGLILASYIKTHGVSSGVQHYLGTGVGCDDCDPQYSAKVLSLSQR